MVTGAAGFIGSNLVDRLLGLGHTVCGVDNFNDYYNPKIKEANISGALDNKNFTLWREDIQDFSKISEIFQKEKPDAVIHLAARAGVRPSIADPMLYTGVNVDGTVNLLKLASDFGVGKFIFGSSSSVYGDSPTLPFEENDLCENIISPYGASKRSGEFFVETFWRNYGLKSVVLRFFTVYGPRGRPDMAPAIFSKAIQEGQTIKQFGDGASSRDYTYIDDIVEGIIKALKKDLEFEIINLGNNHPVKLTGFIRTIETLTGKKARVEVVGKQPGDVERTWANIKKARDLLDWEPKVSLDSGLSKYIKWLQQN